MIEAESFATRLRRFREAAALSQEELAARAGVTGNAVGALERGVRRRPYPHTVRALADALQLNDSEREALAGAARPVAMAAPPALPALGGRDTPIVGRDAELHEVIQQMRAGAGRLLTVTGPGGVGKTRLAVEVAAAVASDFAGMVAVVELAAVRDPELVLLTIGRALGLAQLAGHRALDAVVGHVGERRMLLVLDNLEHLLPSAPDVATLVARCPHLVVLATSRAPLRVRLEQDFPLGPLAVPVTADLEGIAAAASVQAFLARARAVEPRLELTSTTASAIAAICRRLDGLPLALELAAAHARLLPPAALLDRLDSSLNVPRSRDLPERQRTMAAALEWSHDLLTRDEQRLLRRLSVFAGGCTLAAAEQVADEDGSVLRALAGLVDQSLVTPDPGPEARYRMLEPVRQFAANQLQAAGETAEVRQRHADYVRNLARKARDGLRGGDQAAWLWRLERDHGNLRLALSTWRESGQLGQMARGGADTWLYWAVKGYAGEGLDWMEGVRRDARVSALEPGDRAALDMALAGLRYAVGDVGGTRVAAAAAVATARAAGEEALLTDALMLQGGSAVFAGDLAVAVEPLAEAVRRSEVVGDLLALAHARFAQGQLEFLRGEVEAGAAALADAEEIARRVGLPFTLALVLNMQAVVSETTGRDEAALDQLAEAADLAAEVGTTWTLVYTLPALGVLAARRGLPELAATLFAAGTATAEASSLAVSFPPSREGAEHWVRTVRAQLDEQSWQRARQAGRALQPNAVSGLVAPIRRSGPG